MPNNRVFYASQAVAIKGSGEQNFETVQGAQSVTVDTNFNLEQIFQLGRLAIYENIETDPDVEVTVSKALDGHPSIYNLVTGGGSLVSNANDTCDIVLAVGNDTDEFIGQNGNIAAIEMTGMFISNLNYTFPVEGNLTEEITLIGSHKAVNGTITAPAPDPQVNVLRRQNVDVSSSSIPAQVGSNFNNITISANLGREKMFKLGERTAFHRFVNFPLEITVSFDVIAQAPDNVDTSATAGSCNNDFANTDEAIEIVICNAAGGAAYRFDLGSKCKLQSVSHSGGDTGGGNVTITYTYITYNELSITN